VVALPWTRAIGTSCLVKMTRAALLTNEVAV
jgi:hypothetical protein